MRGVPPSWWRKSVCGLLSSRGPAAHSQASDGVTPRLRVEAFYRRWTCLGLRIITDLDTPRTRSPRLRPLNLSIWLGLLVLWIGWGSVYAAMAESARTIPPLLATGVRFVMAGLILAAIGLRRGSWAGLTRRHWTSASVLGLLGVVLGTGGVVLSVRHVASGTVALLAATVPLWVALIEFAWLRRHIALPARIGLVVGFLGTGLLVTQGGAGAVDPFWALVVVLCSAAWALGTVYASQAEQAPDLFLATGLQMVIGGLGTFILAVGTEPVTSFRLTQVTAASFYGWAWTFLVGALAGYATAMWLVRVTSPTLVATASYINPIIALVIGAVLLGEPVGLRTVVAGVAVLAGVVLIIKATPGTEPITER
ncbi:MAG: DMT(drug/metabolite transporter) superfamily permease [Frankiales bacterium]|nr:DMT(drug/metabolite transporter) superfamily permease [Frankiales bacterium]